MAFWNGRSEVFSNDFLSCLEEACWGVFGGLMERAAAGVGKPWPGRHPLRGGVGGGFVARPRRGCGQPGPGGHPPRVTTGGGGGGGGQLLPTPTDVSHYFFPQAPRNL